MHQPWKLAQVARVKNRKFSFVRGLGWHSPMIKEATLPLRFAPIPALRYSFMHV